MIIKKALAYKKKYCAHKMLHGSMQQDCKVFGSP